MHFSLVNMCFSMMKELPSVSVLKIHFRPETKLVMHSSVTENIFFGYGSPLRCMTPHNAISNIHISTSRRSHDSNGGKQNRTHKLLEFCEFQNKIYQHFVCHISASAFEGAFHISDRRRCNKGINVLNLKSVLKPTSMHAGSAVFF